MNEERRIEVEEVGETPKPARARVEDTEAPSAAETFERKRDYLEGFLAKQARPEAGEAEPGGDLYEAVIEALVRGIERVTRIFG